MSVVARFQCTFNQPAGWDGPDGTPARMVRFSAWIPPTGSDPNSAFGRTTPSGNLDMFVCNDKASEQFVPGEVYELTFKHVEPAAPANSPVAGG